MCFRESNRLKSVYNQYSTNNTINTTFINRSDLREVFLCSCCWWWACVFPERCSQAVGSCVWKIIFSVFYTGLHTQTHTQQCPNLSEVPGMGRPESTLTHQQYPVPLWHWTDLYRPSALHSGIKRSSDPWMPASASKDNLSCSQFLRESAGIKSKKLNKFTLKALKWSLDHLSSSPVGRLTGRFPFGSEFNRIVTQNGGTVTPVFKTTQYIYILLY